MKLQDFWSHVDPAPADMCWEWRRGLDRDNYGNVHIDDKTCAAHRVAYSLSYGPIEEGNVIRHLCHNRKCCNPSHLAQGTHQDNSDDKIRAGRQARGSSQGNAKLTEEQAIKVREMAKYRTQYAVAEYFGLSQSQVSRIVNGKRWAHL